MGQVYSLVVQDSAGPAGWPGPSPGEKLTAIRRSRPVRVAGAGSTLEAPAEPGCDSPQLEINQTCALRPAEHTKGSGVLTNPQRCLQALIQCTEHRRGQVAKLFLEPILAHQRQQRATNQTVPVQARCFALECGSFDKQAGWIVF